MTNKSKFVAVLLALTLGLMGGALRSAAADITCEEIGCGGSGSCDFGDPNGCDIDCSDGTEINCPE